MKGKITETDGGKSAGRESNRNLSLVINARAIVCSVSLSTRTKEVERRRVMQMDEDLQKMCEDEAAGSRFRSGHVLKQDLLLVTKKNRRKS